MAFPDAQAVQTWVDAFRSDVRILLQDKGSHFSGKTDMESLANSDRTFIDWVGSRAPIEKTSRFEDTPNIESTRKRIMIEHRPWHDGELFDSIDELRTIGDFQSKIQMTFVNGFNVKKDQVIIDAALGSVWTGRNGNVEEAWDSNYTLDPTGTSGLTLAKLLEVLQKLREDNVDPDETLYWACAPKQITDMLEEEKLTNADYNTMQNLARGMINTFAGFEFIMTNLLGSTAAGRRNIAYAKSGIIMGIGEDLMAKVSERDDKSYANQLYMRMDVGATRTEQGKVHEIICSEA